MRKLLLERDILTFHFCKTIKCSFLIGETRTNICLFFCATLINKIILYEWEVFPLDCVVVLFVFALRRSSTVLSGLSMLLLWKWNNGNLKENGRENSKIYINFKRNFVGSGVRLGATFLKNFKYFFCVPKGYITSLISMFSAHRDC